MNRNFLVTGGAQGIGLAICREILEKGGNVYFTDINASLGEETRAKLVKDFGAERVGFGLQDVTNKEGWRTVWGEGENFFKGKIEALVNNAGIFSKTAYDKVLEVNALGVAHGTMMAMEKLGTTRGGQGGLIVQISSGAGLVANFATVEEAAYSASKHAVIGYVKALANTKTYLREKVRMVAICPSFVDTKLVAEVASPEKIKQTYNMDLLETEEIASAFSHLVVNGSSGDCMVIVPGMKFIFPEANMLILRVSALINTFLIKVLGHNKKEPIAKETIVKCGFFFLLVAFLLFHMLLSRIGL